MQDDLGRAQERLGRTLARARASEDRELAARVRDEGFQLVHLLNGVMHMSRLHSADNRAFDQPVRDLERTFGSLMELLGPLHLVCVEDQIYLNEVRIRGDERGEATRALGAELRRHGVGGLRFFEEPSDAQIRGLVACFARRPADEQPRAALRAAMEQAGLAGIEAAGLFRFRTSDERPADSARDLGDIATRALAVVAEAWENLGRGRMPNPLPLRRSITEILAAGPGAEAFWNLPDGDQPHAAHGLRVACLALVLGQEIGLSDATLQDLGVAALLHDVGYTTGTPSLVRHGAAGSLLVLRQRGFHESKLRRARALLQHHRDAADARRPALFARLLRIVEDYDTLVRAGGGGLSPHVALGRIVAGAGRAYDAALVQAFVNALGRFPPGTRLTLEDGRHVRVVAPGRGAAAFTRPVVRVETGGNGPGERVDLAQTTWRVREDDTPRTPAPAWPAAAEEDTLQLEGYDDFVLDEPTPAAAAPPEPPLALPALALEGLSDLLPADGGVDRGDDEAWSASGEITPAALLMLLRDVRAGRRSGLLLLQAGHDERRLLFAEGELLQADSSRPEQRLEALLLAGGGVNAVELERAALTGAPLGRVLVERGLLTPLRLEEARAAQARAILDDLAHWDDGDFLFSAHERTRDDDLPRALPTLALLLGLARAVDDPDVVRFALGDLDRRLVPAPEAYTGAAAALDAVDRALLAALGHGATARDALARTPGDPDRARASLLSLLVSGLVKSAP